MNNKLKPALFGGLLAGVLSGLLSIAPVVNYCCCLWSLAGGVLAAFLYIKSSPTPVTIGEGAMVGGFAGVFGAILYLIINLPLTLLLGMAMIGDQIAQTGLQIPVSPYVLVVISSILSAIILAVLTTLGGIIGVAIFEKRKNGYTPPPSDFGGTPGTPGSYGTGL
jgi:ammonia channel protein AmtB